MRKLVDLKSPVSVRVALKSVPETNWYWETTAPTVKEKVDADNYFAYSREHAKFLRSVATFREFPVSEVPEVAFVGRSNVGKSSLLNALIGRSVKDLLARTSHKPGCTTTMNLYGVGGNQSNGGVRLEKGDGHRKFDKIVGNGGLLLVDLPGYGEGSMMEWGTEVMKYFQKRKQLKRVFVLIDAKAGLKDKDLALLATLRLRNVPHQVILSKLDRIYVPTPAPGSIIRHITPHKPSVVLQPKGSISELNIAMGDIRDKIQPSAGYGAIGELLSFSSEVEVDGRNLGLAAVRYAVLTAAEIMGLWDGQVKKVLSSYIN
ncbi:hypothetical protein P154DRAFT_428323 [Amniculicola lignicola CBS 123094]|uniref:EngB-type G domain-containing protein n=1 Tax=Amniculicola lignicola CBS 123094 TaxID=1392246 RepID=A0A6A5WNT1_9PLEO|nr:hypothetical protein P154DRAFT_428323 [Amniculicola lignicola CBS 123094]